MLIKYFLLILIGISGGFVIGGGVFAFITMIGVFPRLSARTHTAEHIRWYETCIIWGGAIGNFMMIFSFMPPVGSLGLLIFGFFSGIYVGCLAMALAEVLRVIPIFAKRINLVEGMPWVILAMALGKGAGAMYQFLGK